MRAVDHRFTQQRELKMALEFAGLDRFDLDVAAHRLAVCARKYFAPKDGRPYGRGWLGPDGLRAAFWPGHVWCNPPFSDIAPWLVKTWVVLRASAVAGDRFDDYATRTVTMLLPANRTEQPWWQCFVESCRDRPSTSGIHLKTKFLPGRSKFGSPKGPPPKRTPPFACVLLHWSFS